MQTKNKIKIIKRAERELRREEEAVAAAQKHVMADARKSHQVATRDAVVTIQEWVGELRQKKNARAGGAAHAFKSLFTEAA